MTTANPTPEDDRAAKHDAHIAATVAKAPPLNEVQRAKLAAALRAGTKSRNDRAQDAR